MTSSGSEEKLLVDRFGQKDIGAFADGEDPPLPIYQLVGLVMAAVSVSYAIPFIYKEYKRSARRAARQRQKVSLRAAPSRRVPTRSFATPARRSGGHISAARSPVFLRESRHRGHGDIIGIHEALANQATQRLL